ncbi:MAG: M28 family metallopeptidase [Phycisphaerales bacterium JB041]
MRSIRTTAIALAVGAALALPAAVLAQATAELPQAHDSAGNPVDTYAVVNGEMVAPPAIPMGDPSTIAAIFDEGVNNSHVMDILTHLAEGIGPRLTGSTNVETANNWAKDRFQEWGLSNAHLSEWGTVGMRFDRGPTWGKAYQGRDEYEIKALTTLAWVPGTDGPVRAKAVRMPRTQEEFDAVKDQIPGAWVVIPTDLSGRRGIRGVTGSVGARYSARAEVHNPPAPLVIPDDPILGPWDGTLAGRYTTRLDFTSSEDGSLGGTFTFGRRGGARDLEDVVIDADTVTFVSDGFRGKVVYTLQATDDGLAGTSAPQDDPEDSTEVAFTRPEIEEPGSSVLEQVMALEPAGYVSSSNDERVWTTSVSGWRELTEDKLAKELEVVISGPDYDYINSRLYDGGEVELEFDMANTLTEGPIPVYNTIAEIRGTEFPDEVVVVSAHLDSWNGPGSMGVTDNGTGSAVTLETARILAAVGAKPKRTIRFVLWTGEEQGLLGSRGYVNSLSDEEKAKIVCCFVDDGGTNTQGGITGIDSMRDYLAAATAPINGRIWDETDGKFLNVDVKIVDSMPQGGGSDHASFNAVGIPGFYWEEVGRAVYGYGWHTQYDRLDLAIPNYLRQSATNSAITAYNLACAPEQLSRKETETSESEADSDG